MYALAHSGIADCYNSSSLYGVLPAKEAIPKAEAEAIKKKFEGVGATTEIK